MPETSLSVDQFQSPLTSLCSVRPSVDQFYMRLARFPLTMTKYLDYHHVYSYVVASKNFFSSYPATTQDTPPAPNTDGLINCLPQPGLLSNEPPKSMRLNSFQLIKSYGTLTVSSPGTNSIGLRADAQLSWFLHATLTTLS